MYIYSCLQCLQTPKSERGKEKYDEKSAHGHDREDERGRESERIRTTPV